MAQDGWHGNGHTRCEQEKLSRRSTGYWPRRVRQVRTEDLCEVPYPQGPRRAFLRTAGYSHASVCSSPRPVVSAIRSKAPACWSPAVLPGSAPAARPLPRSLPASAKPTAASVAKPRCYCNSLQLRCGFALALVGHGLFSRPVWAPLDLHPRRQRFHACLSAGHHPKCLVARWRNVLFMDRDC